MKHHSLTKLYLSLLLLLLITTCSFGVMIVKKGGNWPENWPKVMEPFRTRASTGRFFAGSQTIYYYIEFETREEFESVWPSLLNLKSKGAPLTLHNVDKPSTNPDDKRVLYTKPQVVIICPASGTYQKMPDGKYTHKAEWTKDIEAQQTDNILPQFVVKNLNGKWISDPNVDTIETLQQARIELSLYIDGKVIDLNRIRLPENTPIRDVRKFKE